MVKSKTAVNMRNLKKYHGQEVTRASAIRLYCLDCCLNQTHEVRLCGAYSCPIWGYRMGGKWEQGVPFLNHDAALAAKQSGREAGIAFFGENRAIGTLLVDDYLKTGINTYLSQNEELRGLLTGFKTKDAIDCLKVRNFFGQKVTRRLAIRLRCLDCHGNESAEVRRCDFYGCPLWPYRMGGKWEKPVKFNKQENLRRAS